MKKSNSESKGKILYFLRETTIVVIGVLIAVTLNNYKESIDNQDYLDKTLEAVEKEILYNRAELEPVLERHLTLLDSLDGYFENDEASLYDFFVDNGGLQAATINSISLRFFVSNKAELLDFEMISQLSDIENTSNILTFKIEKLVDFLNENLAATDEENKLKLYAYLQNVVDSEQSLLNAYSEFLRINGFSTEITMQVEDTLRQD